jgi:CDP-diacylglycerol--glycerol-3-phosphate 3-phosphatidyltransferase
MEKNPIKQAVRVKQRVTAKYDAIPARRVVTASNIISLVRAFLTVPIIYYLRRENGTAALVFILIALVSDILDGWLARVSNDITELGKILDPFADSLVIVNVMLFLVIKNRMPTFFLTYMVVRYFIISLLGIYMLNNCGISPQSNKIGKVSVVFTSATVMAFIYPNFFGASVKPLMWVTLIFMTLSLLQYIYDFSRQIVLAHRAKKNSDPAKNV